MKKREALLIAALFWITGCANVDQIAPENATIRFAFAPKIAGPVTFTANNLEWTITKASILPGEIGIHWDRDLATRAESRHDVAGKISPKIYGYFAVNLLDTTLIQQLTVGPKVYDHIHMVMLPKDSITTDTVKGIAAFPELIHNSVYIEGTVKSGAVSKPFVIENSQVYGENGLGDIIFDPMISIFANETYEIFIHPDFPKWFKDIRLDETALAQPTVIINGTTNISAFQYFKKSFESDNALDKTARKVSQ